MSETSRSEPGRRAVLRVCVTCRQPARTPRGYVEPGRALAAALEERLAGGGVPVEPVHCFAICRRPCAVALQAPGKWAVLAAGLSLDDLDAIVAAALTYARTPDGIIPWAETPPPFRRGGVARLPPA
ncbi:DUF1636 family protein [Camelimonas abortus]|uniref:DUF1636 family protein n=1 Tax=Camelimonas abortus TaxID=1017184 RepID=A0ABV7LBG5_9HYPH